MKTDPYQRVTDRIVQSLEQGLKPWEQPWNTGNTDGRTVRPLRGNGVPYQGINVLMLWGAAQERGYTAPHWLIFKQALDLGGHVGNGRHSRGP